MISLPSLWLPILVSVVFVSIERTILHMVLRHHKNDFKQVPSEDEVMDSLRKYNIPPGDYVIPYAGSTEAMKSEEFKEKTAKGPVAFLTVGENGMPKMGKSLFLWFVYSVIVSFLSAYITSRAIDPGFDYLEVFRFAGATAFIGYSIALLQNSIWYKRNWCATIKSMFDGLIYAIVTAGVFGWLWPGF